jgi:ribosome-associated protein
VGRCGSRRAAAFATAARSASRRCAARIGDAIVERIEAASVRPPRRYDWKMGEKIPFRLREEEVVLEAVRAQGPGGQNVNKVANAVHLRFDVRASSLPEAIKARLLARRDQRLSGEGVIVIKAQQHRSLEQNRAEALARLQALVAAAATVPRPRRPTRPTLASQRRRVEAKLRRGQVKALRGRVTE